MRAFSTLLACALLAAGCLGSAGRTAHTPNPPTTSSEPEWNTTGLFSQPLAPPTHEIAPVERVMIPMTDQVTVAAAVWRPKVDADVRVPVIVEVGPYWGVPVQSDYETDEHVREFLVQQFVPRGFAVAIVAVRGTSESKGCLEFFSPLDQKDMDAIVTHFGTRPWSNGNVGMIGKSYDGTTPWMAATFGNPHLKTIVPIAGLTSIYDHSFRNGTTWAVGAAFHGVYWAQNAPDPVLQRDPAQVAAYAACPEAARGLAVGPYTHATGSRDAPGPLASYWRDRDFRERVTSNYHGSILLVHGLQDWRVPSHMAFPFVSELKAAGRPVHMMIGQWDHDHPDDAQRGGHVRWDWADILHRWFARYLLDNATVDLGPAVHIEDNMGRWRTESNWPPPDANWTRFELGDRVLAQSPSAAGQRLLYAPAGLSIANVYPPVLGSALGTTDASRQAVEYWGLTPPLRQDLRIAGLPRLHVTMVPTTVTGSRVYAELVEIGPWWHWRPIGHAVMDLRYHDGGATPRSLTPGQPIVARMEFFPMDAVVPAGHVLAVRILGGLGYSEHEAQSGWGYPSHLIDVYLDHPAPAPVLLRWGAGTSVLDLPLVERDVGDGRYPGQPR